MDKDKTVIVGLANGVREFTKRQAATELDLQVLLKNHEELTGYKHNQPIHAVDVYKIFLSLKDELKAEIIQELKQT